MKVYLINMMNAFVLMTFGLIGYLVSDAPSATALIPVFAGALLLSFMKDVKKGNRPIAHFSVILTFLVLVGLIKPLTMAITRADSGATGRVGVMMVSCAITLGFFVRSFISVRRDRIKSKG